MSRMFKSLFVLLSLLFFAMDGYCGEFEILGKAKIIGDFKSSSQKLNSGFGTMDVPTSDIVRIDNQKVDLFDGTSLALNLAEDIVVVNQKGEETIIAKDKLKSYKPFLILKKQDAESKDWTTKMSELFKSQDVFKRQNLQAKMVAGNSAERIVEVNTVAKDMNKQIYELITSFGLENNAEVNVEMKKSTGAVTFSFNLDKLTNDKYVSALNFVGINSVLGQRIRFIKDAVIDTSKANVYVKLSLYGHGQITVYSRMNNSDESLKKYFPTAKDKDLLMLIVDFKDYSTIRKNNLGSIAAGGL